MGKRPEQTLHHRRSTVRKRSHEKMLHVVRHRENANQNDNETPLQTSPNGPKPDAGDTQRWRDGAAGTLGAAGATWRGHGAGRPGGLLRNSSYSDPVSQPAGSLELAPMKRALTSTQHPRADAAGSFVHDGQNPGPPGCPAGDGRAWVCTLVVRLQSPSPPMSRGVPRNVGG